MTSMNRKVKSWARQNATISSNSSSLSPRSATILILIGLKPACLAAVRPASASSSAPPPVMRAKRSALSESRLTLRRVTPARRSVQVFTHERFTTGETHATHAEFAECSYHAFDLIEAEILGLLFEIPEALG